MRGLIGSSLHLARGRGGPRALWPSLHKGRPASGCRWCRGDDTCVSVVCVGAGPALRPCSAVALPQAGRGHADQGAPRSLSALSAIDKSDFPRGRLFPRQPCEVLPAVISARYGETDRLTSLTLGEEREKEPPGSGKLQRHRADVASGSWRRVKNWFYALFIYVVCS